MSFHLIFFITLPLTFTKLFYSHFTLCSQIRLKSINLHSCGIITEHLSHLFRNSRLFFSNYNDIFWTQAGKLPLDKLTFLFLREIFRNKKGPLLFQFRYFLPVSEHPCLPRVGDFYSPSGAFNTRAFPLTNGDVICRSKTQSKEIKIKRIADDQFTRETVHRRICRWIQRPYYSGILANRKNTFSKNHEDSRLRPVPFRVSQTVFTVSYRAVGQKIDAGGYNFYDALPSRPWVSGFSL